MTRPVNEPEPIDIPVDDPDDPRLAVFLGMRDHAARQQAEAAGGRWSASFMAESDVVISRALRSGQRLRSVLVDARRTAPLPRLDDGGTARSNTPADASAVTVFRAGPEVLRRVSGRPELRDPIGCFDRPAPVDPRTVTASGQAFAVLENVTNPNNMGVIMRAAAGLGLDGVLLDSSCCDPLYRRAIRASMGEVFAVAHARIDPFLPAVAALRAGGVRVLAMTPDPTAVELASVTVAADERVAVMLGAEGPGLSDDAIAAADLAARIPMTAGVDSLNVAAAAAIAFHHIGVGRPR